ncbi:MAG: hypothetical protein KatS3mg038_0628 [Candidatus Kapaibacterium sp.]|nr:MAG: hypothetical protein KatS3mg038_0628 [Candidatus Kapabacteria bacterium]GIV56950.1 MAG: hypothetical protein KatS3mg040_1718 [Candidatus Kapabacteria bacterium]
MKLSPQERAALKARQAELRARARGQDAHAAAIEAISQMPESDRLMAERLVELIAAHFPALQLRTWYGMPAWANSHGNVVCFFQGASKFRTRYATLGFTDAAQLDHGDIWPTAFAVQRLSTEVETTILHLIAQAITYRDDHGTHVAGSTT